MNQEQIHIVAKHSRKLEQKLFEIFDQRKDLLLEVAREMYPVAIPGLSKDVTEIADGYTYDENHRLHTTAPVDALRRGAAGFHGNLTSPATKWFRLTMPSYRAENGEVGSDKRQLLDHVTEATEWAFSRSAAYASIHKLYEHCLAFGFACMIVNEDAERIARVETLRVGTYALDIGADGIVDKVVRRLALTAEQIIQEFGEESCPEYILEARREPLKRFEVDNLIEPNNPASGKGADKVSEAVGLDSSCVYRSIYFLKQANGDVKNCGVLRVDGYDYKPIIAPRLEYELGDIYGRGRGIDALDLARGCQTFKYDELNIVGNMSQPAMIADAELKDDGLKLYRGAVNYCRFGDHRSAMAMPANANPPTPEPVIAERSQAEQEIAKLFYNDAFSVIDSVKNGQQGRMTATEVEVHVRDAMQRLAPVATLFDRELLDPLVSIMCSLAIKALPTPLTEEDAAVIDEVNVEYVSAIHVAQKQQQLSAIMQILQYTASIAQLNQPDVFMRLNGDKTLTRLAMLLGFPEECFNPDETVAQLKAAQAKAQQAQMEQQQQLAMAKTMRDVGSTPTDPAHAGGTMLEVLSNGGVA